MKGVINAIRPHLVSPKGGVIKSMNFLEEYYLDDEAQELVQNRNQNLSKTWFFKQENIISKKLKDKKVLIINNEDDFTNMLAHLLKLLGLKVEIKRYDSPSLKSNESGNIKKLDNYDLYLIGPDPGNPTDNSEKC